MIDFRFHNAADEFKRINYEANKIVYDPNKPKIKDILWKHYDFIEKTYEEGRLRDAILDSVQRTLLCKVPICTAWINDR